MHALCGAPGWRSRLQAITPAGRQAASSEPLRPAQDRAGQPSNWRSAELQPRHRHLCHRSLAGFMDGARQSAKVRRACHQQMLPTAGGRPPDACVQVINPVLMTNWKMQQVRSLHPYGWLSFLSAGLGAHLAVLCAGMKNFKFRTGQAKPSVRCRTLSPRSRSLCLPGGSRATQRGRRTP
jgi:hypothetical protein